LNSKLNSLNYQI